MLEITKSVHEQQIDYYFNKLQHAESHLTNKVEIEKENLIEENKSLKQQLQKMYDM